MRPPEMRVLLGTTATALIAILAVGGCAGDDEAQPASTESPTTTTEPLEPTASTETIGRAPTSSAPAPTTQDSTSASTSPVADSTLIEDPSGFSIQLPARWVEAPLSDPEAYQEAAAKATDDGKDQLAELYVELEPATTVVASRLIAFEPDGEAFLWVTAEPTAGRTLDDVSASLAAIAEQRGGTSSSTPVTIGGVDGLQIEQSFSGASPFEGGAYKAIAGDLLYTITAGTRSGDQQPAIDEVIESVTFG